MKDHETDSQKITHGPRHGVHREVNLSKTIGDLPTGAAIPLPRYEGMVTWIFESDTDSDGQKGGGDCCDD